MDVIFLREKPLKKLENREVFFMSLMKVEIILLKGAALFFNFCSINCEIMSDILSGRKTRTFFVFVLKSDTSGEDGNIISCRPQSITAKDSGTIASI